MTRQRLQMTDAIEYGTTRWNYVLVIRVIPEYLGPPSELFIEATNLGPSGASLAPSKVIWTRADSTTDE
jgi:hypothetical protein